MKSLFSFLLVSLFLLPIVPTLVSCGSSSQGNAETTDTVPDSTTGEDTTETPVEDLLVNNVYNVAEDREHFKLFGNRMLPIGNAVTCDFTASGIEFRGYMKGEIKLRLKCDRDTYFTVFVNDERVSKRFLVTPDMDELVLTDIAEAGEYSIRVLKQTEPQWSLAKLYCISLCGTLYDAPANDKYYIEFVGDSITCGYGNLGNSSSEDPGTALWEDGTRSYAFLTAEALGADANVVGCSGIGIDKAWTSFNEAAFYPANSYFRDKNKPLTNNSRVPDLVVINLGTNDALRGSGQVKFSRGVKDLINTIREFYGEDVPIVWAHGMMRNTCFDWTLPVLEQLGGEAAGIYHCELPANNKGANGHPSLAAQKSASTRLVNFIKSKNILSKD